MLLPSARALLAAALLAAIVTPAVAAVGYFSPSGVRAKYADRVDTAVINVHRDRLRQELSLAAAHGLTVHLSLTSIIVRRDNDLLPRTYPGRNGLPARKELAPGKHKVFDFRPDEEIVKLVRDDLAIAAEFPGTLGTIFLVDEPYLNGISRAELERVGDLVRRELDAAGMHSVSLGVIQAGASFNAEFAATVDDAAFEYVERIDSYMLSEAARIGVMPSGPERDLQQSEYSAWLDIITDHRLVTYDQAGSMYTGGGLPRGFDVVGFDFYLSTALLDDVYDDAIAWLARATSTPACDGFERVTMVDFRKTLSFFSDGPMSTDAATMASDRERLDRLYDCRNEATLELLNQEIAASGRKGVKIVVVTEASTSGVLEFDSRANIEEGQPDLLVKARLVDELNRALRLYAKGGIDELLFFTFSNELDKSINLSIGGVEGTPQAQDLISAASDRAQH